MWVWEPEWVESENWGDFAGNDRIFAGINGIIDIGAYESLGVKQSQTIDRDSDVDLYPNPVTANSTFFVTLHEEIGETVSYQILNNMGQIIMDKEFVHNGNTRIVIDLKNSQFLPGSYILQLTSTGKFLGNKKLIVVQ